MGGHARRMGPPPRLTLALPKGRVLEQAVKVFGKAGYQLAPVLGKTRRLVHEVGPFRVVVLRTGDVPTYVEHGAADIGVAGHDVLQEEGLDLYEPLDLGIGPCRMAVAELVDRPVDLSSHMHLRVGTKYPNITRHYLEARGLSAEIIKLGGAVELAPIIGLCDRIVDLVETGETMRQNGLVEVETIMSVTSRLVVNRASLKLHAEHISRLIDRLAEAVASPVL